MRDLGQIWISQDETPDDRPERLSARKRRNDIVLGRYFPELRGSRYDVVLGSAEDLKLAKYGNVRNDAVLSKRRRFAVESVCVLALISVRFGNGRFVTEPFSVIYFRQLIAEC